MRARVSTLRVIQSDDRYPTEDPPARITKTGQFGPWALCVRFGEVDESARHILALMERGRNHFLDFIFGNAPAPGVSQAEHLANRDELIDRDIQNYELSEEWKDPARLYCTIYAARSIKIPDENTLPTKHFWLLKGASADLVKKHEGDAEEAVGYAVARLLIAAPYRHTGPVHPGSPRLYVESDGRHPTLPIQVSGSAKATVGRNSWQPTVEALQDVNLNQGTGSSISNLRAVGAIGKLYLMAYNESDPYKRFIFSYSGLEAIANGLAERVRARLSAELDKASTLGPSTIRDLIWPEDVRDTDPNRSVRFRFAAVAATLSPTTAEVDVATFAEINKARNSIHARLMPSLAVPTVKTFHLLDKYAPLATEFLTQPADHLGRDLADREEAP